MQLGEAFVDRRISSPLAILPLTPGATIEEDDETSDDDDRLLAVTRDMEMPEIKPVWSRRSVADSRRESESDIQRAQSALGWALGGDTSGLSRSVSQEGTIDGSSESWNHHQAQSPSSIQRQDSLESLSSDFVGLPYDEVRFSRSYDSPITPNDDLGEDVEILRKLSGVGKEELAMLQEKLVDRAKLERQALRGAGGDSPSVAVTYFPLRKLHC